MREQFTVSELDEQRVELLPARETLNVSFSHTNIWASNSALAFNVDSYDPTATAAAVQTISG